MYKDSAFSAISKQIDQLLMTEVVRGLATGLHKVDFLDWHGRAGRPTFAPISLRTAKEILRPLVHLTKVTLSTLSAVPQRQ